MKPARDTKIGGVERKLVAFMLVLVALVVAGVVATWTLLPPYVEKRVPELLKKNCPSCQLDLGTFSVEYFPLSIVLRKPNLIQGDPSETEISASAERIVAQFSLPDLYQGNLYFRSILVDSPEVTVTEGDGVKKKEKTPAEGSMAESQNSLEYGVNKVSIFHGKFTYVRKYSDRTATIRLDELQGHVGAWGTREEASVTEASIDGTLEKSGTIHLEVGVPLHEKDLRVNVRLTIDKMDLSHLNPMFEPSDGIKLRGMIVHGQADTDVMGRSLTSTVDIGYYGLDIIFEKTKDRGALKNLLAKFLKSVKLKSEHAAPPSKEPPNKVTLERKPKESLVSFILRGMKQGAFGIAF